MPEASDRKHGLGVLPADRLQGPPALRGEDRLVADVALVADGVMRQRVPSSRPRPTARQSPATADVGRVGVPAPPSPRTNAAFAEVGLGTLRFIDRSEHPVAFLHVLGLRVLEVVEGPEHGEQPLVDRRRSGPAGAPS